MISVIIPLFNRWDLTKQCLANLGPVDELILVDNGSTDETAYQFPDCDVLIRNKTNRGFAKGCNQGAGAASGTTFVFLNNDTICPPGWLDFASGHLAGCHLTDPDGMIIHQGVGVDFTKPPGQEAWNLTPDNPGPVRAVTGACMAVSRRLFCELEGFDEGFWNGYEDVDLCLRAEQLGYQPTVSPVTVTHLESQSGPERWSRVGGNIARLRQRWG